MLLILLILMLVTLKSDAEEIFHTAQQAYSRCPTSNMTVEPGSDILVGQSELQCVVRCSQSANCSAVTVCPASESGSVMCDMRDNATVGRCVANHAHCHLIKPMSMLTDALQCENGGVVEGGACRCPLPFAGHTCQRHMRDCHEGWEHGHNRSSDGLHFIQPISSSSPFQVRCEFDWKVTYALWRGSPTSWSGKTWLDLKTGFIDSAGSVPQFFIGLDHLHEFLGQAKYRNHVGFIDNNDAKGGAHYNNFKVGPESTDYAISYDSVFFNSNEPADNEFESTKPVVFSGAGHDTKGCAASQGAPGWYGEGCQGPGLFADPQSWSVNGTARTAQWIVLSFYRQSPFVKP